MDMLTNGLTILALEDKLPIASYRVVRLLPSFGASSITWVGKLRPRVELLLSTVKIFMDLKRNHSAVSIIDVRCRSSELRAGKYRRHDSGDNPIKGGLIVRTQIVHPVGGELLVLPIHQAVGLA
jgi:hypothetical protein